jgi:hypothetical protein
MRIRAAVVLALLSIAVLLQLAGGVYAGDLAGYPDEAAHYVTALMLHDYAVSALGQPPMQFALDYYLHYPKVAIGHWPPAFYLVQAAWMLVFSASKTSVLVLMAVLAAVTAAVLYGRVAKRFGVAAGLIAGCVYLALPVVQEHTGMIMAEGLLTLFCFLAALAFGSYLDSENWRDAAWFGVFTSAAILTKGNAWALMLIPPIALALTRKWRLLRRRTLWLTSAGILAACLPWQLLTLHLAVDGWAGEPGLEYTLTALWEFTLRYAGIGGIVVLALAVVGMVRERGGQWAAMLALIVGTLVFHCVVPAGIETRKLMTAAPALLLFAVQGAMSLVKHRVAAMAAVAAVFAITTFSVPMKPARGFGEAATKVAPSPHTPASVTLVTSDASGEGAFISEVAMRDARPNQIVLRASKVLGQESWGGEQYKPRFSDAKSLAQFLDELPVQALVIDTRPAVTRLHHSLVLKVVEENAHDWVRVAARDPVLVYRRAAPRKVTAENLKMNAGATLAGVP